MSIAVLGAGAFGTALAISLARDGTDITLWARSEANAKQMQLERINAVRLPNTTLPHTLSVTSNIDIHKGISDAIAGSSNAATRGFRAEERSCSSV